MPVTRMWNGTAWEDVGSAAPGVTLDTAQTITGQKTFSLAPLVPDSSFSVAKLSATGTRDATTYLRGDGTWATVATGAPANMLTTDTAQTITGLKTVGNGQFNFTRQASVPAAPAADNVTLFAVNDSFGVARLKLRYSDGTTASMRAVEPYIMAVTGALTVQAGKSRVYLEDNYVIESIRASVNTAPAGSDVVVDINLNGTSIFTANANKPAIAPGANTGTAFLGTGTTTAISTGQYLTVDVDQIGSTTAGSDLTVVIRLRRV